MQYSRILILLILVVLSEAVPAQNNRQQLFEEIRAGKEQIYQFNLPRALQIFREIQKQYPDYPHGYFYEAYITVLYFSQNQTSDSLKLALEETVNKSLEAGEKYRKAHPDDPDALYYMGISNGVRAIYYALNRDYIKAYFSGRSAKNDLENVVKMDSTYYDAYLGLGIFHYYLDLLPGLLKFVAGILGFSGDRVQGMHQMQLAAQHGTFFRVEARFAVSLTHYFLEGEYTRSVMVFKQLRQQYPQNPLLSLLLGYHYRRMGQIPQALSIFSTIPDDYRAHFPDIEVMKQYNIIVSRFLLNQYAEADSLLDNLLQSGLRKTPYYLSAIAFYKGQVADLQGERTLAEKYYSYIVNTKETQYWYNISRMYARYRMDRYMRKFTMAGNDLFTHNYAGAGDLLGELQKPAAGKDGNPSDNPDYPVMLGALRAVFEYQTGRPDSAVKHFRELEPQIREVNDKFVRSWLYIDYARLLRYSRDYEKGLEVLKKAEDADDDYTRIIVQRERFILNKFLKRDKT